MSKEDKSKIDKISISTLEISNLLATGKKIATISVGSTPYNILAPATYAWSEITSKPTTLAGYGITDAIRHQTGIVLADAPYNVAGYGYSAHAWKASGPAMSIGIAEGYLMQIQSSNSDGSLYHRHVNAGTPLSWYKILDENNYASVLDDIYLRLTGGTVTGKLEKRVSTGEQNYITFSRPNGTHQGHLGFQGDNNPIYIPKEANAIYTLLHTGNVGEYALKIDGSNAMGAGTSIHWKHSEAEDWSLTNEGLRVLFSSSNESVGNPSRYSAGLHIAASNNYAMQMAYDATVASSNLLYRSYNPVNNTWGAWKTLAFTDSEITGNASSATKLEDNTAYTAWGQTFFENGKPKNVTGDIRLPNYKALQSYTTDGILRNLVVFNTSNALDLGDANYDTNLIGNNLIFKTGSWKTSLFINSLGNVSIGTIDSASSNYRLHVGSSTFLDSYKSSTQVPTLGNKGAGSHTIIGAGPFGLQIWSNSTGSASMQVHRFDGTATAYDLLLQQLGGNVIVGGAATITLSPTNKNNPFIKFSVADGHVSFMQVLQSGTLCLGKSYMDFAITQDGRVGIGIIAPTQKLDVNGNVKATSFIGNLDGTYVNKLTGYTKATAISALTATDTLNTALGKLEYKADVAYNLVRGAYDGDGTIENLEEILRVLDGIKDTETIKAIVGKYLPLTGGVIKNGAVRNPLTIDTASEMGAYINFAANGTIGAYVGYNSSVGAFMEESGTALKLKNGVVTLGNYIVLHSGNYNSYAPKLDGTGATGTWNIDISGDANTLDGVDLKDLSRYIFKRNITYGLNDGDDLNNLTYDKNALGYYTTGDNKNYLNSPLQNFGLWVTSLNTGYTGQLMLPYGRSRLHYRSQVWSADGLIWTSWDPIAWVSDIPTKVSQLTNDSGYLTSTSLNNYVTLNTAQTISAKKTFNAGLAIGGGATERVDLPYFLGIDAFDDGGSVRWLTASKVCAAIGALKTSGGTLTGNLNLHQTTDNTDSPKITFQRGVANNNSYYDWEQYVSAGHMYFTCNMSGSFAPKVWFTDSGIVNSYGFAKSGSSNNYVLLGAGGHKAISDFVLSSDFASKELSSNLTTITKSITLTKDWQDTGISINSTNFPNGSGTYVVQVYIDDGDQGFWGSYFSGIMSVYTYATNATVPDDEIILHHSSHACSNQIYLKTKPVTGSTDYNKLYIACNKAMSSAISIVFKFKKLI